MQIQQIIKKKRNGGELSREEIEFFVKGYTEGSIPDYQASALLMAIFFKDLNKQETFYLTDAMERSGEIMDLSDIPGIKVDKHSTGGVGDKTTFVVAPISAAAGVPIAKMSGRGLGFTGGTVDKMESIPGFKTTLSSDEFKGIVKNIGMCVIGQSEHIAAADKKIYSLRSVTETVDNIGLIVGSIMSKKLACGSDAIVLDVKCGSGAFMKELADAEKLAEWMIDIGKQAGKNMTAIISDMNQPLGEGVGNSIEVIEAIETLKCQGPADITELSVKLAGAMIHAGGKADSYEEGVKKAEELLKSGAALNKFREFVEAQGGNPAVVDDYSLFPQAGFVYELLSEESGYVSAISADKVGSASLVSGAGRAVKEDDIDPAAGIILKKKIGDAVEKGEVLAEIYAENSEKAESSARILKEAYEISDKKPEQGTLIYRKLG